MTALLPFSLEQVERSDGPLVHVLLGADGGPVGAVAARLLPAPRERVFRTITEIDRLAERVPMMDKIRLDGDQVTVHLRFGIGLFSARFSFRAARHVEAGRAMELRYLEGEPRDLRIRHEVHDATAAGASVLFTTVAFDAMSLGFLAKYFLKHHPEIRFGVFPGSALTLSDAVLRAVR